MHVSERFLKYVSFDTQSDESSTTVPTTEKQKLLGAALVQELTEIGLHGARMDDYGYVYAWLPATAGCEGVPCLGLIAHMDTAPSAPGANVSPRVVHYTGGDIHLSDTVVMRASEFESLRRYVGQDLIVTDGTTLLGADDKAGVAEIVTAMEHLAAHPEIPHGRIAVAFTPDEEVGSGADHFDVEGFGAAIHPGSAKDKMRNACLMALEFASMLPPAETPAHTEGREGFYHLSHMEGDETEARLSFIIRDHDRQKFEARKERMNLIAAYLNEKYGPTTVQVELKDSYYNMLEQIRPHMYLIHRARAAFEKAGVQAVEVPIRGGTDGARLSYMGLPCPNLSTGGANFHGVMEYIPVPSMEKMVEVLVHLVTEAV